MTTKETKETLCHLSKEEQKYATELNNAIITYFSVLPHRHAVANSLVFTGVAAFATLYPETHDELVMLINKIYSIVDKARAEQQPVDLHKGDVEPERNV